MITYLKRKFFTILGKTPATMEMVSYWKTNDKVEAKLYHNEKGVLVMQMVGEKYPFPGFPRGHILFGSLSKLKHEIKNQMFNDSWKMLEEGKSKEEINERIKKEVLPNIFTLLESQKYDIVPSNRLVEPVREIHRAWTKVGQGENSLKLRDVMCHVLQEDDAYRFRVQWLASYFPRWWGCSVKLFEKALMIMEHAEIIGDMKERIRLLRRILLTVLSDDSMRNQFYALCKEINWKRVRLSKADRYFFRGKYFRCDLDKFEY